MIQEAVGGAYEGASRTANEIAMWNPASQSADAELLGTRNDKKTIDARAKDLVRNDGYILGAINIHQDSIVGSNYSLSVKPDLNILSKINPAFDEVWMREYSEQVESMFTLWGESPECYPDASRVNTFTDLIRLGVGVSVYTGEILASAEWFVSNSPFKTHIKMIDTDRLSTPDYLITQNDVVGGIKKDKFGAPLGYYIRNAHESEIKRGIDSFTWRYIPARKSWGRKQIIHIFEQKRVDQSRSVGNIVASLKQMKMTNRYEDIVLQNAVMNATFAATIESELPPEATYAQLNTGGDDYATRYLQQVAAYTGTANNIKIDNARIPHLYPGQKLKIQNPVAPAGVDKFEQSLLRHVAASLGLSYEQFSRDYTNTSYASARASMSETHKHMMTRKKIFADRFASNIYQLWFEEAINRGAVPLPNGVGANIFYQPMVRDALCGCSWIGASRGQIDPLKETQAAILKIEKGLSTYEIEAANFGYDFRDLFNQRQRENQMMADRGLNFTTEVKPNDVQDTPAGE